MYVYIVLYYTLQDLHMQLAAYISECYYTKEYMVNTVYTHLYHITTIQIKTSSVLYTMYAFFKYIRKYNTCMAVHVFTASESGRLLTVLPCVARIALAAGGCTAWGQ